MVQVKPPEDWEGDAEVPESRPAKKPFVKPVPDPNLPETVSTVSGSVAEGLEGTNAKSGRVNENRWQGDEGEGSAPNPAEKTEPTPPPKQPDMPGDQWDSSRAKQRKKLLVAFSSAAAILVFGIVAIVFAVLQFTGGNSNEKDADGSNVTQVDVKNDKAKNRKDPDQQPKNSKDKSKDPKFNEKDGKPSPDKDASQKSQKENTNPGKEKSNSSNPDAKGNSDPEKSKDPPNTKKKDGDAPEGFGGPDDDDIDEGALPDFFREIDKFAVIFEQDEPLLKLREAFKENDLPGSYGLSRYFVSRSLKKTPDPKLALLVPIAKVDFKQTTLLEFLHFHYQLSSVPVSVDLTPILLSGVRLDQKFDFTATNKTTREMLKALAEQLGLELVEGSNSLVLTIKDRDNLVEIVYPVEDIAPEVDDRKKLMRQIEIYINRKSWSAVGGAGIITANDDSKSIVVKHFGWAQVRVAELLRNFRVRKGVAVKTPNGNFPEGKNRLELAESAYKKKITLLHANPVSLSKLFGELARTSDLHVFINWESTGRALLPSGNLPLAIEDEEFGSFINEFAEGVKLQLVWHSPNVVELTSRLGESSNLTFESYDIKSAVSRTFPPDKLLKALRHLLASNNLADFERAELGIDLQDGQSVYAVLPQSAHLNVLKILKTAETVSASKK